jgi:hypothetical protein
MLSLYCYTLLHYGVFPVPVSLPVQYLVNYLPNKFLKAFKLAGTEAEGVQQQGAEEDIWA